MVRNEWLKKSKLSEAEEERRREDKIQLNKSLAKTLAIEMGESAVRKSSKRDMTSEELDQEFRELNASQLQANAKLAVE